MSLCSVDSDDTLCPRPVLKPAEVDDALSDIERHKSIVESPIEHPMENANKTFFAFIDHDGKPLIIRQGLVLSAEDMKVDFARAMTSL